jgi:hypothetical protein
MPPGLALYGEPTNSIMENRLVQREEEEILPILPISNTTNNSISPLPRLLKADS